MNKFEYEYRKTLVQEIEGSMVYLNHMRANGDQALIKRAEGELNHAEFKLKEWDQHIVAIAPAPPGLVASYKRHEGGTCATPVIMYGVRRDGEVSAMVLSDDGCLSIAGGSPYSNFLEVTNLDEDVANERFQKISAAENARELSTSVTGTPAQPSIPS